MSLRYGGRHPKERKNLDDDDFAEMMCMARAEDRAMERATKGKK